jgi:hypothetical protein
MDEGREAVDFQQLDCKKSRIWPLDLSHWRPKFKGCRSSNCPHGSIFGPRRWTLERSLDHTRMETQTMVEKLFIVFVKKNK